MLAWCVEERIHWLVWLEYVLGGCNGVMHIVRYRWAIKWNNI